ncbi:chromosome segregation protein SMC [Vaginisenegalia massiliensis]|uniref:chromosome segregation protein SMC n=1 Tax=Vaginisenegalia massiliensis TaxID=2058294 RepID=UPI003B9698E4
MYLARIEMTGFKSFADKTVIEFDQGMTAVVGPNGSGKSNLSEAIRWVLGEQSAKSLRGSRMEDVIFNGTQDRKAVNLAKVTLVLNNEDRYLDYDFSEIAITRSYNRNGESHYYINNEAVRLKDIVDLLLDSGLGRNSFAMISQGKVETIFLNKPEERRSIFEEAAGVQKYQYRKVEAERKLVRSSDHLSRVKDILHELEGQLKPLKKQKEAALIYQEKHDQLRQLEISLYCYQITLYQQDWQKAQNDLDSLLKDISQVDQALEELEADLKASQAALDITVQELDDKNEKAQSLGRQIEQVKAQVQMLEQRQAFNASSQQDKQAEYERQQSRLTQLTAQENDLNQELSQRVQELNQYKIELRQLKQEQDKLVHLSADQIEQLRAQLIDQYQLKATSNNQIQHSLQQIETLQARLDQLEQAAKSQQGQVTATKAEWQELKAKVDQLADQWQKDKQSLSQLMTQEESLRLQRENLQSQIFKQERQTQFLETKVQSMNQMQEDYEGYYAGVKAIMKQSQDFRGIVGPIADLIEVPSKYQLAIEIALGAALQHIVVESDQAAKSAIQYLKDHRLGRATFLPLPHIKARQLNPTLAHTVENQPGYIGLAVDLIDFSSELNEVMANLLATTVVCHNLDQAQAMAKQVKHQVKIVTLDGEILMPGGALTGGRNKQQGSTMLARQNQLKNLAKELKLAQEQLSQLEADWQVIKQEEASSKEQAEKHRIAFAVLEQDYRQAQQNLVLVEQKMKQNQNQTIIQEDERLTLEQRLKDQIEAQKQAEQALTQAETAIMQLTDDLNQLNLSQEERQTQAELLTQTIHDLTTKLAVKELECKQSQETLENLQTQIQQIKEYDQIYQENQATSATDLANLAQEIEQLKQQITDQEAVYEQLTQAVMTLRQQREELNQGLRQFEAQERDLNQRHQQAYQLQAKLEATIEKFDALIDNHLDYLNQEYQLSYEAAVKEALPIEQAKTASQEVKSLKREIEQLGPINLAAIEDYQVLADRFDLLKEQEDDLLTAIHELQETMTEMDQEVIKRFSTTFEQINRQFQLTFKKLFGGGQASLELTDPDDLLTSGVDIIAQPPGKRKQHLALLSGGERAFTAIALLFAILETKPVPFCVLDEVEAALDDANVYRYGQYLQNFTENTQFIVITHRKGTMEHADVLYGVTMEKSGVSKLASVRLSEAIVE